MVKAQPVNLDAQRALPMPPFTIKQLRDAIPAHLFERSAVKSFAYLGVDLAIIAACVYAAAVYFPAAPLLVRALLWLAYWAVVGTVGTGVWVIAHECGHQAFSNYKWLNDSVGLVLHSALLVPYHSWRISHGKHHKNTNHMERDQVFVPSTRSEMKEAIVDSPLYNLLYIIMTVTVGWPAYLLMNSSGQTYGRRTNHFEPSSPIFKEGQFADIIVSDVGIFVALASLLAWGFTTSFSAVFFYYFVPYLIVNFFLVTITILQHTHVDVPHYRGDEWTFIRGALSTIDRSYGWLINIAHHHIQDSHVAHHLFSTMPHYNAIEATEHLKPVLGKYYSRDDTNFFVALWGIFKECKFVEDTGDIVFFRKTLADHGQKLAKKAQ